MSEDETVGQLEQRFLRIFDVCKEEVVDQKVLRKLTDDFNYVYRKANVDQQGEYHARIARLMKGNR